MLAAVLCEDDDIASPACRKSTNCGSDEVATKDLETANIARMVGVGPLRLPEKSMSEDP